MRTSLVLVWLLLLVGLGERMTQGAVRFETRQLAPAITFDEIAPLTENPVFTIDNTTISFGTHFEGQTVGTMNVLLNSVPTMPLFLASQGARVATTVDLSNPSVMVLGALSTKTGFSEPIAIKIDAPVARVEFDLGHLDAPGTTQIVAYDADGNSLGQFENLKAGTNEIALVDDTDTIAGVSIFVAPGDMDWEGFAIDNLAIARASDPNAVPEPSTIAIWSLLSLMGAGAYWRHKK